MAAMSVSASASLERKQFPVVSPNGHRGQQGSASSTPNQHPYAIKTTSTAILTRSNSTGHAASHQHVYIPSSPTPAARHRHSKSDLSRPSPRPLPIPPSLESPTKNRKGHGYTSSEELVFPSIRGRADTLPHATASPSLPSPVKVDELPSNPRVWTTSQLASYLITALRVRSGEALPVPLPVAKDIAAFVKEARLNGRSFLRLNEKDLESMGINNLWREALLNASRNLRQNVLKGRIWGFEDDDVAESTRVLPYRSFYNSSSSSIDETLDSLESTPQKYGGDHKGRVRGLVASLERTSSSGSSFSNRGSSTSEGDVIPVAWADEEASFASGSEASEIEDRKARAVTKKRLLPDPPAAISPEAKPLTANVSSPEQELSVEDLLASDSMSSSWGARAWEDMNIGETVKHIGGENGNEVATTHDDVFGLPDGTSKSSSGKLGDGRKGEARTQAKDIFTRPLPSCPLPSPPKSEAGSPVVAAPPLHTSEKIDKNIQVNSEPLVLHEIPDVDQDTSVRSAEESERLREVLSVLEQYRQRLAELEEKICLLECKDAEQAQQKIERCSQGIETDAIQSAPIPVGTADSAVESRSFISEDVQRSMNVNESESTCALTTSKSRNGVLQAEADCGAESTRSSQHSSTSAEEPGESVSPLRSTRSADTGGPRPPDNHDWDPLLENGLSSYVLMVSVGVCAVVLSTILKRLAGKKT